MNRRTFLLACLAVSLLSVSAGAEPLLVMFDKANPPFMYATVDNKAAGVYPALVAEAFSRMEQPAVLEVLPWKRALHFLDNGRGGLAGLYMTEERLKRYDYSEPLHTETTLVVQRASAPFPYLGLESLRGRTLGVLRGWSYGDEFEKARAAGLFTTEEVEGDAQNFEKLLAGRIDALLAVKESAETYMASSASREKFTVQERPFARNNAYLAFSKESHMREFLDRFNKALAEMRRDGAWDSILKGIFEGR